VVARREGTGEYEVSALLDWNNVVAVPVEICRFCGKSRMKVGRAGYQARQKSKCIERSEELRSFFKIVKLIPIL
jgi:hypothetical protein